MNDQSLIAKYMTENIEAIVNSPNLPNNELETNLPYEKKLSLTQRYIDLMGGTDIAHEMIDKVAECNDCLEIDNNGEESNDQIIGSIASLIPTSVDNPTSVQSSGGYQNLYNPNNVRSS